jgi:hypothetical protein
MSFARCAGLIEETSQRSRSQTLVRASARKRSRARARADLQGRFERLDASIEERFMNDQNLTIAFSVGQTPKQVFDAINNVRG